MIIKRNNPLKVFFYKTDSGNEPVREWLKELPKTYKKIIGEDIKTVQIGWPLGMPLVRKLAPNLWEIRITLKDGIARILFTLFDHHIVLLHGFIKKSQKIPEDEFKTANKRLQNLRGES